MIATSGPMVWVRRVVLVASITVAVLFWALGLLSGAWAVRQLGPATFGNRTVVFGQAAGPWFTAGGLVTIAVILVLVSIRRPAMCSPLAVTAPSS